MKSHDQHMHQIKNKTQTLLMRNYNLIINYHFRNVVVLFFSNVLIYKLGGTSLELCVISVCGGMYRVVSSHSDRTKGGNVMDELLAEHFATEFQRCV